MQVEEVSPLHVTPGSTISAQLSSRYRVKYSVESKDFYQLLSGMYCGMWLEMENEMGFDEKAPWLKDDVQY